MDIEKLIEKLNYYNNLKSNLEEENRIQLGNIEQKVLEYRLTLAQELENKVKEYAEQLHEEYTNEHTNDLEKLNHYIELLESLIKEQAEASAQEEGGVNE